jgi:bacillithiol biosynthesis deacetylase BshB1
MTGVEYVDLLAFGPHPDDVELNVGGILALHAQTCWVGVIDLTEGEMASNGTVETRQEETRAASEILQLTVRENLQIPDGGINPYDPEQQRRVVWAIRRYRPEIVLLPYWEDRHPDHVAASRLIEIAIFKSGLRNYEPGIGLAPHRPSRWYYYLQHEHGKPDLIVDVSEVYPQKLAAIQAYRSQFVGDAGVETLINRPTFLQKITARDQYLGAMVQVAYGEGLMMKEPWPVGNLFEM